MNKSIRKDILIVSFALFSMFFGAGNVIFPPYLGLTSGSDFLLSALGFIITGAGLPILGIIAIAKSGTFDNFSNRVFNRFPLILGTC
ncbi:MAG: branched-chain amino acid transport system II carrier protein, partial [Peptoanaerobacter stomatis]|uniref:branched-chain amino acid transport system II carrier protein n=1 Tax=Peptoanaerobacter stomatis TaxID=796937 RepID=UPI003F9ECE79